MTMTATGLYAICNPAQPQLDRQALSFIIANVSAKTVFWMVFQHTNAVWLQACSSLIFDRNQTNLVLLENKTDNSSYHRRFGFAGGFFSFSQEPLLLKTKTMCKKEKFYFQSAEEITLIFLQLLRSLKLLNAFSCQISKFSVLLQDLHGTLFKTKFSCRYDLTSVNI